MQNANQKIQDADKKMQNADQKIQKGVQEGIQKELQKKEIELVQKMLKENANIDFIIKVTGLHKEEIENIAKQESN